MSEISKNQEDNSNDKISPYDKLVVDIRNNLSTQLAELISKLLDSTQEQLFDLSNEADSNEEQTRYFDLMNQIRMLKPAIANTFNKRIKDYLVPAATYEKQLKLKKTHNDDDELSLIGQDEMEGMVLVKNIGERAAAKCSEQLSHLKKRLEHLALKTDTVFKNDALVPTNICQAFDDALADDFNNTNKKVLFALFDIDVASKLDVLYDATNQRLIDADILPQIKLHMGKRSASQSPTGPAQADHNDEERPQDDLAEEHASGGETAGSGGGSQPGSQAGGNNISGFAMTAPPGGGYRRASPNQAQAQTGGSQDGGGQAGAAQGAAGGNQPANNNTGSSQGGGGQADAAQGAAGGNQPANNNTGGSQGGSQAGADQGAAGGNQSAGSHNGVTGEQHNTQNPDAESGEYQHYTAGMPASRVGRVLGNYIGAPFTPDTTGKSSDDQAEYFPESTQQHFGHQEIIQALSSIQSRPEFQQADGERLDGEAIKQAVLAEIAKTSGGAVTKRINQIAEKTIDFIELIFDAIIDDENISDAIKALLLRLQIPVIKASMSDQEFFIYDDHPARVLLDTIADVGVGITEHTDEMYLQLDKVISSILGEYDLSTETFQTALDNLNAYIEGQEAITRSKEEEEQKILLRKHARVTVLKALRATTTGKILPEAVHPLILKRWPTLMFNHYLLNGKENDEWIDLVMTLRRIVDSVQAVTSAEHLIKLKFEKDLLFYKTEKYLNTSSKSKKDVQNIMDLYKETVQDNIDDANFTKEQVNVAKETVAKEEPVEEAPIEEDTGDRPAIPPNIMPGMWFQVHMGEGNQPRRCKLSVILVEDASLMFVNYKGELLVEKSFDEFNEEVANDKTTMIMGHSAFDHAFKAVINRLD